MDTYKREEADNLGAKENVFVGAKGPFACDDCSFCDKPIPEGETVILMTHINAHA